MSMFCYQCQETAKNTGCTIKGVCGKDEQTANLQDLLIYTVKGIAEVVQKSGLSPSELGKVNETVLDSLFKTITNANFDPEAIKVQIKKNIGIRDELAVGIPTPMHDAANFPGGFRC